jgi:membrane-bound lytic murein transglycosylase B
MKNCKNLKVKIVLTIALGYLFQNYCIADIDYIQKAKIRVALKNFGVASKCIPNKKVKIVNTKKDDKKTTETKAITKEDEKKLKKKLKVDLENEKINDDLIEKVLDKLEYLSKPIQQKKSQPEVVYDLDYYINRYNLEAKSAIGVEICKQKEGVFNEIDSIFSVDYPVIMSIWGVESNFGSLRGSYSALNVLYSLALNAGNYGFFYKNLLTLIKLIDIGYFDIDVKSSWAGAIGGPQFMPYSIYLYAISFDKSGKSDIINNNNDVIASIGSYLYNNGWSKEEAILNEVHLPEKFDNCMIGMNNSKTVKEWEELGVKIDQKGIGSWYKPHSEQRANIIVPDINKEGVKNKRAFMVYDNFKVVLSYNKSSLYALAVAKLYDLIKKDCILIKDI